MPNPDVKIGLFYGSTTCYTEMAAEKIQDAIGSNIVDIYNIKDVALAKAEGYDNLIFGISTWDFGELQEDWESQWDDIKNLNLDNKIIGIYGLGDQLGYSDWFQDAVGMLHDEIAVHDCQFVGYWPSEGYEFAASKALTEDKQYFVGLSLDDENQYEQTDARIAQWTRQILAEIKTL